MLPMGVAKGFAPALNNKFSELISALTKGDTKDLGAITSQIEQKRVILLVGVVELWGTMPPRAS